ncbi:MAG: MerR family transcriptional regulator [Ilumatobacteraceae bacterium]
MNNKNYFSIGEVLGLLLEEFPDVTISKIRFLESQGLIEPERTASGYRKFSDTEIERLRFILREQRERYLPLKVIRTRLEGDTSDGAERPYDESAPRGIRNVSSPGGHPAARQSIARAPAMASRSTAKKRDDTSSLTRTELLNELSVSPTLLKDLTASGLVKPRIVGDVELYSASDRDIVGVAAKFLELGIDVRHMKGWKHSADREIALFEQRIVPLLRQRNPASRDNALAMLTELADLGEQLRAAFIASGSRQYTDGR